MMKSELRLEQSLKLAPQMQYALSLLQMNTETLTAYIQEQALANPVISMESLSAVSRDTANLYAHRELSDESKTRSLQESLREQLPLSLSPELKWAVQQLIDLLEPTGYLRVPRQHLLDALKLPEGLLDEAMSVLRGMDPPGIGAATAQECLLLQLKRRPDADPVALCIVQHHLEDAAAGKLKKIAKEENISLSCVENAFRYIRTLSPYPANGYHSRETVPYILPDVSVVYEDDTPRITVTAPLASALKRNPAYEDLLAHAQDPEVQNYLTEKAAEFTRLELAVAMRTKTLLNVTDIIARRHQQFFKYGSPELPPLSLEDISTQLDLHISTVSRAIKDKHLICPWGIFPLKRFLARYSAPKAEDSAAVSQDQICLEIKKIIAREDKSAPVSDSQILLQLQEKGICISRRTVANYREKLGIPGSPVRKS